MSLKIVAPVVVKPDIDSKKASTNVVEFSLNKKGNAPNNEKISHTVPTIKYPSFLPRFCFVFLNMNEIINPVPAVSPIAYRNPCNDSLKQTPGIRHNAIRIASKSSKAPMIFAISLQASHRH